MPDIATKSQISAMYKCIQLTTQYTLNFPNVIGQLYLNKTGGKSRSHSGQMSPKLALSLTEKSENKTKNVLTLLL